MSATTASGCCHLVHHGAAATSSTKILTWLPSSTGANKDYETATIAYASHAMISVARPVSVKVQDENDEWVWNAQETLRTTLSYSMSPTEKAPTITALSYIRPIGGSSSTDHPSFIPTLAAGFSNGSLAVWNKKKQDDSSCNDWQEEILLDAIAATSKSGDEAPRSITDLKGVWLSGKDQVLLASCSSAGVAFHSYDNQQQQLDSHVVTRHTASAVQWEILSESTLLLLIGTAAPRHNKILIYSLQVNNTGNNDAVVVSSDQLHYCGALTGHEDWITCFAWQSLQPDAAASSSANNFMLASASQDWKIRLWRFTTTSDSTTEASTEDMSPDDDEEEEPEEEDFEEHESRMEIHWQGQDGQQYQTGVSLEALLYGHEGPVTGVEWYPQSTTDTDPNNMLLLSSSMDRSIFLWSPSPDDGIWTPVTRVGSAGGILGGSVGSTLLGYLNVLIRPPWLLGHAHGGALHIWHSHNHNGGDNDNDKHLWNATPCLTGHFGGVTDLCWESTFGEYLLTVSLDQTCRLWAPLTSGGDNENKNDNPSTIWAEVARPQVHGYDLSAITSLSRREHRHWMVSGADEKELRILDAPMTTVRILKAISSASGSSNSDSDKENDVERVERAYIPSLGLSNKATAADGAEEDVQGDNNDDDATSRKSTTVRLPLERDLGALSLWLETRKLFGHNTELYCVTSTLEAQTAGTVDDTPILVASTTKARDVDAAAIHLWNPHNGECVQVLSGGHKSTVATMSFSPSNGGKYLASSGKDRRLCVWKRSDDTTYQLAAAKDTAHKRIIWSVHFLPYDATILASGSRDGNIKIWKLTDSAETGLTMEPTFSFAPKTLNHAKKPDAVTALAFAPQPLPQNKNRALLALGLECGLIELWSVPITDSSSTADVDDAAAPQLLQCLAGNMCHVATVTKLAWRPLPRDHDTDTSQVLTLASGSSDHGCRIFEIDTGRFT